jgi:hypothetical protein
MKIRPHNLDIQAWSTYTTRFKLVSPGFDIRVLKTDEYVMVSELREWWNARGGAPGAKGEVVRRDKEGGVVNEDGVNISKKMKKISEMEVNTFSDLVCEVPPPAYLSILAITEIDILGGQNISRAAIYFIRHRLHSKHVLILLSMVQRPQRLERSLWEIHLTTRMLGRRSPNRRNV